MPSNIKGKSTPPLPGTPLGPSKPAEPAGKVITGPWPQPAPTNLHQQSCGAQANSALKNQKDTYLHHHLAEGSDIYKGEEQDADAKAKLLADLQTLKPAKLKREYKGEYNSWRALRDRCKKGKGTLHPAFNAFESFLRIMGLQPDSSYTIDRIECKNPEYSPANCRWASKALQTSNKGNAVFLTVNGETRSPKEWAKRLGISVGTIYARRSKHPEWPDQKIVYGTPSACLSPSKPSSSGAPDHDHAVWEDCLPGRLDKSRFESHYLKQRLAPMADFPEIYEPRDVWLFRNARAREARLHNKICLNIDPRLSEPCSVPEGLKKEYDACREVAAKARAFILSHHSAATARSYLLWASEQVRRETESCC